MLLSTARLRLPPALQLRRLMRSVSTLPANPHIKVFPNASNPGSYVLTYLDTDPPDHNLAIGTTTAVPPTSSSFRENRRFLQILNDVLAEHAQHDDDLVSQAKAFAGPGGASKGSWVHLSDTRNPPDYGRIAWPEDILGSVEVDGSGDIIGNFQPSGTYRIITNEGILGLSDYIREKLVSRLRAEEAKS